jgi:hypothetical protein
VPSPKSGDAGSAVAPQSPAEVHEADDADPGEVASVKADQRQIKKGKYGSEKVSGAKPEEEPGGGSSGSGSSPSPEPKAKTGWIEVVLVDKKGQPVPGEPYRITLPDGTPHEGTLSDKGFVRIAGFAPGACKVTFPNMDSRSWKKT